jgi:hypothetical protein
MYGVLILAVTLIGAAPTLAQSQQPGSGYPPAQSSTLPAQPPTSPRTTTERQLPRTKTPEAAQPSAATDIKF